MNSIIIPNINENKLPVAEESIKIIANGTVNLPKLPELIFEDNKIVTILNNASNKSMPIPIKKSLKYIL